MIVFRKERMGILFPGFSAEDDLFCMAEMVAPWIDVELVHTAVEEDAHRPDALRRTGRLETLLEGAEKLKNREVGVVVWACTSASFVFGREGALDQCSALREFLGVPASSTSIAFVSALQELNLRRVAIAATYPEDVVHLFQTFLESWGIETVRYSSLGVMSGVEVAALTREDVLRLVEKSDHPEAQGVLVPDTALHTAGFIDDLENAVGNKPVLTANQVTIWHPLRLLKYPPSETSPSMGTLFGRLETESRRIARQTE